MIESSDLGPENKVFQERWAPLPSLQRMCIIHRSTKIRSSVITIPIINVEFVQVAVITGQSRGTTTVSTTFMQSGAAVHIGTRGIGHCIE